MTGVLRRLGNVDTEIDTHRTKMEGEIGARHRGFPHPAKPEARKSKEGFSLRAPRGSAALLTPNCGLPVRDSNCYCFKLPSLRNLVTTALGKQHGP